MILTCSSCGQKNRVQPARLVSAKCGGCQAALDAPDHPVDVDVAGFDGVLASATGPVLVDFWAPWCAPCRQAAPEVAKAASRLKGRAIVLKVDTQAHPELSARYGIQGIPYFAVFRGGRRVAEQTGLVPADVLVRLAGA